MKPKKMLTAGAAALGAAALWQGLTVRSYAVRSEKIEKNVRLLVVSDLHSSGYGPGQRRLIERIAGCMPDVILLTGDIVDDSVPPARAEQLAAAIGPEYPCYYVTGNHEFRTGDAEGIKDAMRRYGITVLDGCTELVNLSGQLLRICGVDDPTRYDYSEDGKVCSLQWMEQVDRCRDALDGHFSVLLCHRPELTALYRDSGFDLVVSGHTHGGQVRLPGLVNGVFAPGQGLLPKYGGGAYQLGSTELIVSRGLCRDLLPRVFNPPELVCVDLQSPNSAPAR